jgi:hypothetical protein
MSELSRLQAVMLNSIQARRALPRSPEAVEFANLHIAGNASLSPVEQLEIYRQQFWLRHTSSLAEDYPGLGGVIGQTAWQRLVEEYLGAYPPQSFSLRDLGLDLPEFVESAAWLEHQDLCIDMARLERAYLEIFDCADPVPLDPSKLAAVPEDAWERAVLELSPALRLVSARYPVLELWRNIRDAGDEAVPIPQPMPQNLAIYRAELRIMHEQLSEESFAVLEALGKGIPLVPACEAAQARFPEKAAVIEAQVGTWFQDWGARSWIVDVKF